MIMATTLETSHVTAAVLSVFHNAADLAGQISKRQKKKKSEQALRLKWLLETLEQGELQISQKYGQNVEELGHRFKVGDDISRDRIQHVAIIMQAELLRSLQLGVQFENAELDARKLQDDAAFFRRDVLSALDELRTRLLQLAPTQSSTGMFSQMVPSHQRSSISSPTTLGTPASDSFPAAVSMPPSPAIDDDGGSRMSRLFSLRSKPHKRTSTSSSTIQNMVLAPNLSWLGPVQAEPEKFELAAGDVPPQQQAPLYTDIKVPLPEPDTEMLHPAMMKQTSVARHASTSTHSSDFSNYTRNSTFSDEKIPVVDEDDEAFFPDAVDIAAALPPVLPPAPLNVRARHNRVPSSSSHVGSTLMSTPEPTSMNPSPTGLTPDYSPHSYWFPQNELQPPPTSNPVNLLPPRDRSNTTSSSTSSLHSSLVRPASLTSTPSSAHTTQLVGRPERKNNYWGFCKGAWTIREDWHKGLHTQVIPTGVYAQSQVWQCKHCSFRGSIFGNKKPYTTDPNVHEHAETGVRYRWIFLAKSHTKVPLASARRDAGFGCLFCSLNNVQSSVYGNEGLLFEHILDEHAEGMTDGLATRARCVLGRKAEAKEGFDINIV